LELAKLVDEKIIYVSGEETDFQIASRAKRLGISGKNIQLLAENCIEDILETLVSNRAEILIIDSISVMHSKNIT
jgi:DNA repair protein radA